MPAPLRSIIRRLSLAAAVACVLPVASASASEVARPADAFVDSIGVNVHMTYLDTAYRDRDRLVGKLSELGIRHVRDGLHWNTVYAYKTFNQLADRGIRTTFIMGDPSGRGDTLEQKIAALKQNVLRGTVAVEGPNEYSYSGDPQWAPRLRDYQRRLHAAIKGDPALRHLPVLAPSLISPQDHDDLGDLTDALDFGNKHSYPSADIPEGNVVSELATAGRVSGNRPVWVTESGYHNAIATKGGHRPISEAGAATYLPRMFLEYYRRGIQRTFSYELIDLWPDASRQDQERNFGFLRNDYSEKPAFRNLKNLIALLSDGGAPHRTQPLDYTVENAPADMRRLVLQKRDGSHYLVLWRAVRVWDPVARHALAPDTRQIDLRLAGSAATAGRAQLYSPSHSADPVATAATDTPIPVRLGADPIVIRVPATAAGLQQAAPGSPALVVPPQTVRSVLRDGLVVRCRADRPTRCRPTARRGKRVLAKGRPAVPKRRVSRVRARATPRGRRDLRRALRERRRVTLRVQVRLRRGKPIVRSVVLDTGHARRHVRHGAAP